MELCDGGLGVEFPRVVGGRVDGVCWVERQERVRAERGGRVKDVELCDEGCGVEFPRVVGGRVDGVYALSAGQVEEVELCDGGKDFLVPRIA